jgi:hypothetical protein
MAAELKRCKYAVYCKFCKSEGRKVTATLMTRYAPSGGSRDHAKHFSCEGHKLLIEDTDPDRVMYDLLKSVRNRPADDGDMTEADYQTWWRL